MRKNPGAVATPTAAMAPAARPGTPGPTRRLATLNASTSAMKPLARATTIHRPGAAFPNSANTVVNSTGSGFHVGPPVVLRSRWMTSLPQMSQDQAS
jgi:hypothetical protein